MITRQPIVAGQFYPDSKTECIEQIEQFQIPADFDGLPAKITASIVPHAGWMFSGQGTAIALNAIKQKTPNVDTFIIFGAAHSHTGNFPSIYAKGAWNTPLGDIQIDTDLATEIVKSEYAIDSPYAHNREHSIEVQLPIIQHLFPEAKIVPITVPPASLSQKLGKTIAQIILQSPKSVLCIATTDLTHYGPRYNFTPMGINTHAIEWAHNVNDKYFIDAAMTLDAKKLLETAAKNQNACGPGACAALVEYAKTLNIKTGHLLWQTNSAKIMLDLMNQQSSDSVGYASIIF